MTALSVVIITRNQEWNVDRLVQSVIERTSFLESREIVLVDSASSDRTTDIAARYPITVLKLRPDQLLTAAAGRYVGFRNTTGELVLFLDGDHELCEGWLQAGLDVMRKYPDVAVVSGQIHDVAPDHPASRPIACPPADATPLMTVVPHGGPAALYRRRVLDEVGPFNPYIISDEEPELCVRIRHHGYRVVRLERTVAHHYSVARDNIPQMYARWRKKLYVGSGQNLRYKWNTEYLLPYIRARGHGFVPLLVLLLGGLVLIGSLVSGKWRPFRLWAALLGAALGADAIRKRSAVAVVSSVLKRLFIAHGTVAGVLMTPYPPDTYPARLDVIKKAEQSVPIP